MDNWGRFDEKELPPEESFYSELANSHISDEDYARANAVWDNFKLNNSGEYHDFYLTSDVLLLTDVFEHFRTMCMGYYDLDPAHYYTLPNSAWDAMLLKTDVELDFIQMCHR